MTHPNGQCVMMEERCNQVVNCRDQSDENNCQLLDLKKSYNKKVAPITATRANNFTVVPAAVNVSIILMKIVSMEEVQHSISFQFEIILEWMENRAIYNNLKVDTFLNLLSEDEINSLWIPYVIYDNTDMKEAVQLEYGLKTTMVVSRQGGFYRSGVDEADEVERFDGSDNMLTLRQTYTKTFQCEYFLQYYPFDKQVRHETLYLRPFCRFAPST